MQHVSFSYPDAKKVLQDINLRMLPGEKVALAGMNGSGKSTLLQQLNGVLQGQGKIVVGGIRLHPDTIGMIRAQVGLVFQDPDDQLFSPTVYEDVAFGLVYQGMPPDEIRLRVTETLELVGMAGCEERMPYHLSGGEKKRVALATVLCMCPELLVLDEPTAGLDPRGRRELICLLRSLPQTMLIATHDLEMARQVASRLVVLDGGQIVADGAIEALLSDPDLLLAHGLT
jgi:energy-coupling factor transporter ATP-binding protein EcfA2